MMRTIMLEFWRDRVSDEPGIETQSLLGTPLPRANLRDVE
jgi:hypothetical protein